MTTRQRFGILRRERRRGPLGSYFEDSWVRDKSRHRKIFASSCDAWDKADDLTYNDPLNVASRRDDPCGARPVIYEVRAV